VRNNPILVFEKLARELSLKRLEGADIVRGLQIMMKVGVAWRQKFV
jgi:hypothetical protein